MNQRLPLVLSATALVVALVGSTPLGNAAQNALEQVPRAKRADFASNAGKLNGHKSSLNPKRGQIPVVGADGKLPASIGGVGPPGAQGERGPAGASGYQISDRTSDQHRGGKAQGRVSCELPGRQVGARRRLLVHGTRTPRRLTSRVPSGLETRAGGSGTERHRRNREVPVPLRHLREHEPVGGRNGDPTITTDDRHYLARRRAPRAR